MTSKLKLSTSLLVFTVGILSIRFQNPIFIILPIVVLFALTIYDETWAHTLLLTGLLVSVFPAFQFNTLYGRDSHFAAANAVKIQNIGWPIPQSEQLMTGFSSTPLMHFHAIIVGEITNVPIYPNESYSQLISSILPIIYTATTVYFVAIFIRECKSDINIHLPYNTLLLPVIMYIPLFSFHTGFRRESVGILLFAIAVYLIYKMKNIFDKRFAILLIGTTIAFPFAHHFSSFVFVSFLIIFIFSVMFKRRIVPDRTRMLMRTSKLWNLLLILMIMILILYFFTGQGGGLFLRVLAGLTIARFDNVLSFIGFDIFASSGSSVPYMINRSISFVFKNFLSKWLYQFLIAIGIVQLFWTEYNRNEDIDMILVVSLLFGAATAVGSLFGYLTGTIPWDRLFSFFTISSAWLSLFGIKSISEKIPYTHTINESMDSITVVFCALLLITGLAMIPTHVISTQQPNFDDGALNQQFTKQSYSTMFFVDNYVSATRITGDATMIELIGGRGYTVVGQHSTILSGNITSPRYVALGEWNKDVYMSKSQTDTGWLIIDPPPGLMTRFNTKNSKIYDNGATGIYHKVN